MILATATLWLRDVVRFYRQRSRIVGALGSPIVFWLLLGSGLGHSFRLGSEGPSLKGGYLEYFYSGTLALIVLFTAIFSTISVIEDRQAGFLQGVLVAPVPRSALVLGKVLGGTSLALMQAAVFLLLSPVARVPLTLSDLPAIGVVLGAIAFAMTGLGFLIAWSLDSTQGFHAIMNLVLIPMWILSGAVFPASGAAGWIRAVMAANPLTYGVAAIRAVLPSSAGADHASAIAPGDPTLATSLIVVAVFGLIVTTAATRAVRNS
jgi:ABC-2 type transport system permease protein